MLFRKKGFPEEDELVLCTVTKVQHNSVFVNLDEYDKGGMIHISEISPGRIRNIRDFVVEGKKIVCKILNVNPERGYIDLSLRRVNESQKKNKISEIKLEQKAEKIIEILAKQLNIGLNVLYSEIFLAIQKKYPNLSSCFQDVVLNNINLEELGIKKNIAKDLREIIIQRIKPEEVSISGDLKLVSYAPDGIDIIKETLKKIEDASNKISVFYEGGAKYKLIVKASDYKEAESLLKKSVDASVSFMEKKGGEAKFVRAGN